MVSRTSKIDRQHVPHDQIDYPYFVFQGKKTPFVFPLICVEPVLYAVQVLRLSGMVP